MKRRFTRYGLASIVLLALAVSSVSAFGPSSKLDGDLCKQRPRFDLNDIIARGDFVDVMRKPSVGDSKAVIDTTYQAKGYGDNTERQTVVVDGIIMELPGVVIEGQIRIGAFIPVYPGTEYPIGREDWGSELPCWANPDCPD